MVQIIVDKYFEQEIREKAEELGIDTKEFITSILKDKLKEHMKEDEYKEFLDNLKDTPIEIEGDKW